MKSFKIFLITIWIVMFIGQALLLNMPFVGSDAWRNAQTYSVARNFVEEDFNLLKPKYDIRETLETGYYPGEFPLQTALTAVVFKVFGTHIALARAVNLLFGVICGFLIFVTAQKLYPKHPKTGYIAATLFSVHSLLGFLVTAIMPETLCIMLSLLALYAYIRVNHLVLRMLTTVAFLTLAICVKPTGFLIVVLMAVCVKSFSWKHLVEVAVYFLFPLIALKLWISYTMQFENFVYGCSYAITHHYARTMQSVVNELTPHMIIAALEKTLLHGFNVAGFVMLGVLIYYRKNIKTTYEGQSLWALYASYKVELGLLVWALANFAFLLYAGAIQTDQTYYAAPICLPLLFLASRYISLLKINYVMIVIFLQLVWKWAFFQLNYIKYVEDWGKVRLEQYTDQFSTRKDLFLAYHPIYSDFTVLGRLGRRGINIANLHDLKMNAHRFDYLYIKVSDLNPELETHLKGYKSFSFGESRFFKLR